MNRRRYVEPRRTMKYLMAIQNTGDKIMSSKIIDNFNFFLENYNSFYEKYGHSFIVIKNHNVIGVYGDFATAVHETKKAEKIGDFIVQECNGDASGYSNYIASSEIVVI